MKKNPIIRLFGFLSVILTGLLMFSGCLKEEIPYLELSTEGDVVMDNHGGTMSVEVKTNQKWTATSDADWCVIQYGDGSYKGEFVIKVAANTTVSSRRATVTVQGGQCVGVITIKQAALESDFAVTPDVLSFTNQAESATVVVTSNIPWTAASSASWCKTSASSGTASANVEVSVEENMTGNDRKATVVFSAEIDGKTLVRVVTVNQSADSYYLILPVDNFSITNEGGTMEIPYIAGGKMSGVECHSGADWITVTSCADGKAVVSVTKNVTGKDRTGTVSFNTVGQSGDPVVRTATIFQSSTAFYLELPITEFTIENQGGVVEIPYLVGGQDVTIECGSSSDWATIGNVADGKAIVNVAENRTGADRTVTISFSTAGQTGEPLIRTVKITQSADAYYLTLPVSKFSVAKEGGSLDVNYVIGGDVTGVKVTSGADWATVGSVQDGVAVVTVAENTTGTDCTAEIAFSTIGQSGDPVVRTAVIFQSAYSAYLELPVTEFHVTKENTMLEIGYLAGGNAKPVECTPSVNWIVVRSCEDGKAKVEVLANDTQSEREAKISISTVSQAGVAMVRTVIIRQSAESFYLELPGTEFAIDNKGGKVNIPYAVAGYGVSVQCASSAAWATVEVESNQAVVTVAQNKTGAERTVTISFQTVGQNGDPITRTAKITQSADAYYLTIPTTKYSVAKEGGNIDVAYVIGGEVTGVKATSSADWVTVGTVAGGNASVTVAENKTGKDRTAEVTFSTEGQSGDPVVRTITVFQSASSAYLKLSVTEFQVNKDNNMLEIGYLVGGNAQPVECSTSASWLVVSSCADGKAKVEVKANDTGAAREGTVSISTVSQAGETMVCTATVRQSAESFYFEVPANEVQVTKESTTGLEISYVVAGNVGDVTCTPSADWITVQSCADGKAVIDIAENKTGADRSAVVSLTAIGQTGEPVVRKITVNQSGMAYFLTVPVTNYSVSRSGGEVAINYSYGGDISGVTCDPGAFWISVISCDGGQAKLNVAQNLTNRERTAKISFSTVGQPGSPIIREVTLTQSADNFYLTLPIDTIRTTKSGANLRFEYLLGGQQSKVEVHSEADWITVGAIEEGDGDKNAWVNLTVSANTSSSQRSGIVTVHTVDQEDEPIVRNLTVIQSGEESFLDLLVNEVELISSGDTIRLPFNSSKPVTVKSSADWCASSVEGNDIVIKAGFNMVEDRTAYVTVMMMDGGEIVLQKVIKVHQAEGVVKFEFSKNVVTLDYSANTSYVQLTSTGEWVLNNQAGVDIPQWLTVSPVSGSGDALITLKAKANNFMKERTTQLSFTNKLSGKSIAIEIVQSGNPNGIEGYKYLGMGYDAAGEYASDGSVRAMMVDMDKLEEDGMIAEPISLNTTIERYIYGKTYEEYQSNLSQTANIGGKYTPLLMAFRLSVSNSFSAQSLSSQENEFASFRSITEKRSIKFLNSLNAETMKNYLLDNVKADINSSSVSPETLFAKYGTHILTGFILGGSLDYSMSADVSSMSNAVEWSVAASGGFKNLAMGISASVEVDSYNRMKKESSNFESSLKARGGESQYTSQNPNVSESTYTSWLSSLENQSKWVMIDYDGSQLIPIWELADDATRQSEIEAAAKTYLEQPIISKVTTHRNLNLTLAKIGYMGDDAGSTAELKNVTVWANLDGKGEYQMVAPFDQEVDDNAGVYPKTSKWGTVNKGPFTVGSTNISMYKSHVVNLRAYLKEDDTTSPDEYAGNLQLIYEPGTGKWSANGNVIDNGGESVLSLGSAPNAQMLFTLNWTE